MIRFNVYGISDWPEDAGQRFPIFFNKLFVDEAAARAAAVAAYHENLQVVVEHVV